MRIFLYGMQSSGASLVTFFLAQLPRSVAVVDLWNSFLLPPIDAPGADHVIGKVVVTTTYEVEDHVTSFQPDRTILVLRHPVHNYASLGRKYYADENGSIDDKFRRLEATFLDRASFDLTLLYEDFVLRPGPTLARMKEIGLPLEMRDYAFPRSREEILAFNLAQSRWCREHFEDGWSFGNVQGRDLDKRAVYKRVPRSVKRHVERLCPNLCAFFDEHYAEHTSTVQLHLLSFIHDVFRPAVGAVGRRVKAALGVAPASRSRDSSRP